MAMLCASIVLAVLCFGVEGLTRGSIEKIKDVNEVQAAAVAFSKYQYKLNKLNLTGCRKLFLDIGSNVGVHSRQVFEGARYTKSKLRATFARIFGDESRRSLPSELSGVCSIGFEANPRIASRLGDIENAYKQKGWKAFFIAPLAVGDKRKSIVLSQDKSKTSHGSSIANRTHETDRAWEKVTIPMFDFEEFMEQYIIPRRKAGEIETVFAKMDIEGAEFLVIPKMLAGQGMCKSKGIDVMTIEWHDAANRWNHIGVVPPDCIQCDKKSVLKAIKAHTRCKLADVVDVDDEAYAFDPIPLPGSKDGSSTVARFTPKEQLHYSPQKKQSRLSAKH